MPPNELQTRWGQRLRALRAQRDLSLSDLASLVEITKGQLSRIENGLSGASDEVKVRIAAAYGVRVEDIWTYPEPEREAS